LFFALVLSCPTVSFNARAFIFIHNKQKKAKEKSQDKKAKTGQAEPDRQKGPGITDRAEQDRQNKKSRTRQAEQPRQDRTVERKRQN
jgi:hypothetical protein